MLDGGRELWNIGMMENLSIKMLKSQKVDLKPFRFKKLFSKVRFGVLIPGLL